jgi:hypothetical protein
MVNLRSRTQTQSNSSFTPVQSRLLQRSCDFCGQHTIAGGECTDCAKKKVGLQRKLTIGASNDPLELEADLVADQVMSASPNSVVNSAPPRIQRFTGQTAGQADMEAPASVDSVLASSGSSLDPALREDMEKRFGHDFSRVRVHTGSAAERSARDVNANAYTVGNNVVFGAGQFSPKTHSGKRLLAHELTHVVQQGADHQLIRRQATCPIRPPDEVTRSRRSGGILSTDVITPSANTLVIQDFSVNDTALPIGVTTNPVFERFMSIATGDPSTALAVKGYTDCVGAAAENLSLRDGRAQSVIAAMPPTLRSRPRFSWPTSPTTDFRDTNATEEGRASNRAVEVTMTSVPPVAGQDPCDLPNRATNIDQYMFLVRCAERRLSLTTAANASTMVSALRQIYYGNATWSSSSNPVWNMVITDRPWSAGNDPANQLGIHLFAALRDSQVVAGHDMGHLLTGLDAMLNPHEVELTTSRFVMSTGLSNEEWATWAGDVGSAVAEFAVGLYANPSAAPIDVYFARFANSSDLLGNLDSFAIRAGLTGLTPNSQLQHAVTLSGTFSEVLMQYFRITSSTLSQSRTNAARNFITMYGGVLSGNTLTNRATIEAALRPSVENFAGRFVLFLMLQRNYFNTPPATPGPQPTATLPIAVANATRLYVDFLLAHL